MTGNRRLFLVQIVTSKYQQISNNSVAFLDVTYKVSIRGDGSNIRGIHSNNTQQQ